MLKYPQESSDSVCLSGLALLFHSIEENKAATAIPNNIE